MRPHFESSGTFRCGLDQAADGGGVSMVAARIGPQRATDARRQRHNRRFSSSQAHLQSLTFGRAAQISYHYAGSGNNNSYNNNNTNDHHSSTLGRKSTIRSAPTPNMGASTSTSSIVSAATAAQPDRHLIYRSHNSLETTAGSVAIASPSQAPSSPSPNAAEPCASQPTSQQQQGPSSAGRRQTPNSRQLHSSRLPPPYSSNEQQAHAMCRQPDSIGGPANESQSSVPGGVGLAGGQQRAVNNFANLPPLLQMQTPPTASLGGCTTVSHLQQQQCNQRPYAMQQAAEAARTSLSGGPNERAASYSFTSSSKSKSCLACADISIKWYIVVIALLGLICALIGTIVGAVHSVGRDYFSLALLLLGVGLVLVAISWIALRITINTYKSGSSSASAGSHPGAAAAAAAAAALAAALQQQNAQLQAGSPNGQQPQQSARAPLRGQQQAAHNALYVMAAAAAAAAAANSQRQEAEGARGSSGTHASPPSASRGSLATGFKRRLPRRLARLISAVSQADAPAHRTAGGAGLDPAQSNSNEHSTGADNSPASRSSARQASPGVGSRRPLPTELSVEMLLAGQRQPVQVAAAAASMAALASILQQQQQHQQLMFPGSAVPSALMPPAPHPLASMPLLFGHLAPHLHEPAFRAPPPSYNAAMQEQRVRMLMQERAALHHLHQQQQQQRSAPPSAVGSSRAQSVAEEQPTTSNSTCRLNSPELAQQPPENAGHPARHDEQSRQQRPPSSSSSGASSSTIVNIGAGETTVRRFADPAQHSSAAGARLHGSTVARADVKIVGNL